MLITINQTEICYNEWYAIEADCPFGSIIEWEGVYAPPNIDADDIEFLNPNAISTFVKLPKFDGQYGIRAICRTP